jgi:hypothetical protein
MIPERVLASVTLTLSDHASKGDGQRRALKLLESEIRDIATIRYR